MRVSRLFPLVLAVLLCCSGAAAQDYSLEMLPDKMVIHVEKLGLQSTSSVKELLMMIPALSGRNGDDESFGAYDLQVDGKSTGTSREVILNQTKLYEIDKVEISNSPTVTQQKNGEGGVINIVFKKMAADGHEGKVSFAVTTNPYFIPGLNYNFKKRKLELRSSVAMEYYNPDRVDIYSSRSPGCLVSGADTLKNPAMQETVRLDLIFKPTENDELKAWLWESFSASDNNITEYRHSRYDKKDEVGPGWEFVTDSSTHSISKERRLNLTAAVNYRHVFGNVGKLELDADYNLSRNTLKEDGDRTVEIPNILNTGLKFEANVLNRNALVLKLEAGENYNLSYNKRTLYDSRIVLFSPYMNFKYESRRLTGQLGLRYQNYTRNTITSGASTDNTPDRDITGNLNVVWQLAQSQALRFIVSRNLIRPTDEMAYSVMPGRYMLTLTDVSKLHNAYIHSVELGYIRDWHKEDFDIVMHLNLGYDYADGLFETRVSDAPQVVPVPSFFIKKIVNSGINNIFKMDVSGMAQFSNFSLTLAGNFFSNIMRENGEHEHYNYFNISMIPTLRFAGDWTLGGRGIYNSEISRANSYIGDCIYAQLNLTKTFGRWHLYAELSDIFDYDSDDYARSGNQEMYWKYDMYKRYLGVGAIYKF